uniref:Dapper homolog 3 n=1 Tax=Dicentrarchus labrax TaxID=13489 RepID=A0A8C4GKA1_DICLA
MHRMHIPSHIAKRSRNKERLEASLAGLCELELLKQRQECRVLSALCLGDSPVPGRPPWGALRSARCSSLQCTPWGVKVSLEQQVAELKVNTEVKSADSPTNLEDSRLSSGKTINSASPKHWRACAVFKQNRFHESNYHPAVPRSLSAPGGTEEIETGETWLSDPTRRATVTDVLWEIKDVDPSQEDYQQAQKVETYIFGLIQRRALPSRPSKPRTSLAHDARAVSVVRQSSLCHKEQEQHSPKSGVQPQPGLYDRPRQASVINSSRSTMLDYPSFRVLQAHPDSSNSEPDSPQHFHNYPSPPPLSKPHQLPSPDEQLVNAEYIPAQPCRASTRAYAHHHPNPHKGSAMPKPNRSTYSPERIQHSRSRVGPKKCRSNEDKSGASRKPGKKACRSQSENSLQRVPERKYNTVERDGGGSGSGGRGSRSSQSRSKKQQQGSGNYRRWQSTLELSQDEGDQQPMDHCGRRTRKSRPTHASYAYPHHHHSHHHQHMEYQLERDQVLPCQPSEDYPHPGPGESESSMSEADSPDSSSLSSDSDESGGLVWPQQLPPQLSLPSPPAPPGAPLQPKAFVKIKASHALKKKILRFRTGSLKVMTTV